MMAKDGTRRGGARPGAGRKPKALSDKIKDGQTATAMMQPAELETVRRAVPLAEEYAV